MSNKNPLRNYIEKIGLPSCIEHEEAVLSALIHDKAVIDQLTERGVGEEYFHSPIMRSIYLACKDLVGQGKDIDLVSINAYLKQNHSDESITNAIFKLEEMASFTLRISTHIDGLIEFDQRREKTLQSIKSFEESYNGKFTVLRNEEIISSLESWADIRNMEIKVEWLVDRHIPKGSITLVFGKGGIGKTWLMLQIARCIGNGESWLGFETTKAPIIFIDFENPLAVLNTRTQKLGDAEGVHFWRANNDKMQAPKLDSNEWVTYKSLPKGAVLIFDTLRASQGKDENDSKQMGFIMNRLKELRDSGFTIILLHHTSKNSDNAAKGSTAIVDLADHSLGLTRIKKKKDGHEIVVDDDDSDEEAIYRFGDGGKTRYEPYHSYLTLNPDKGFELAPDPQEDTLKSMHDVLTKQGTTHMTTFIEKCLNDGLSSKAKLRKFVDIGHGRYWNIENRPSEKNAKFVIPKSVF